MNRLKKYFLETYIPNKYNHLLGILILALVLAPFAGSLAIIYSAVSFLFLVSILLIIKITTVNKNVFRVVLIMALFLYLVELAVQYDLIVHIENISQFIVYFLYALFMFIAIIFLTKGLFADKKVTGDTIKGGISIYLLLGIFWSFIYHLIDIYMPLAFMPTSLQAFDFVYLSFTTLTTLGYGDITPVSQGVKMLTSFEAVTGQMFIGVFIARLIGLHIAHHLERKS
ncbi:MAG: potassium channel family protein [Candidatus Omnitrophica bacterium]|nr:potassium channel family protein [Candidatus Omnitrophota bacterium]